ncbi:MAG: cytochrome c3 family protein [Rectinemataceae bacterium]
MNRIAKAALALALAAVAILVFVKPGVMVGPGTLIPGHRSLTGDCRACHKPFAGANATRCVVCHKPQAIGLLNTKGLPISKPLVKAPFHQKLIVKDCVACHSDHAGVMRSRLQGFNHGLLETETRDRCQDCHRAPEDNLHRQISGNCTQCHSQQKWTPATFAHDSYFMLDRDHAVRCATCHGSADYTLYTCYGCHEHSPSGMRSAHIEEGIRSFENCAGCHKSADKEGAKDSEGSSSKGSEGEDGGEGDREDD